MQPKDISVIVPVLKIDVTEPDTDTAVNAYSLLNIGKNSALEAPLKVQSDFLTQILIMFVWDYLGN